MKYQVRILGIWITVPEKVFYKCTMLWRRITPKEKNRTQAAEMSDVKYEYGCEITSTSECPLREEIRAEAIDECIEKLAKSDDTILSDRQYYTLIELKEQKQCH